MKKVIFYISLVLGLCHTLNAKAIEAIPTHTFEITKNESARLSQNSKSGSLYLVNHLIDIEEDEIPDPARDKFSLERTATKSSSIVSTDFHANFFRYILSTRHFYHCQPSYFISLRVLKL